jgi:hypothetical protein
MASRERKPNSFTGAALYAFHFIFEAFGTTRPIRLGLVVALSAVFEPFVIEPIVQVVELHSGLRLTSEHTVLYAGSFGIWFCFLFAPLLIGKTKLPEPVQEYLKLLATVMDSAGLSKQERKLVYLELIELILSTNPKLGLKNLDEIKARQLASIKKSILTLKQV